MSSDKLSRRKALKRMGGSAAAVGALTNMSVNVAAAEAVDGDITENDPVEILEGAEKLSLAVELARTSEFGMLVETAQSEGYSLEWDLDEIYAGRTRADSFQRDVVSYNLTGAEGDKHAAIHIGRDSTDDSIVIANFDIEYLDDHGIAEKTVRYQVTNSDAETASGVQELGGSSAESEDTGIRKTVIESDPEAKEQFVRDLEARRGQSTHGGVTTEGLGPDIPDDFPAELDITTCNGCYYASTLVCRNLCGAAGGFVCGLLGISIVGGVSCVTFVGAVCWVAGKAPSCAEPVAATICKGTGLGICGPNEKPGSPLDVDIPQF